MDLIQFIQTMNLQKLLKMVLELRTEGNIDDYIFLGCDGGNRYDAKL